MRETTRFQIWRMDGLRLLFRPSSVIEVPEELLHVANRDTDLR